MTDTGNRRTIREPARDVPVIDEVDVVVVGGGCTGVFSAVRVARMGVRVAWKRVKANKGAAGVDGVGMEDVEQSEGGAAALLAQLERSLRDKTCKPKAAERVMASLTRFVEGRLKLVVNRLLSLGIPRKEVHMAARSRKAYPSSPLRGYVAARWRMSANSIVQRALTNRWLHEQGVPDMRTPWITLHYGPNAHV